MSRFTYDSASVLELHRLIHLALPLCRFYPLSCEISRAAAFRGRSERIRSLQLIYSGGAAVRARSAAQDRAGICPTPGDRRIRPV